MSEEEGTCFKCGKPAWRPEGILCEGCLEAAMDYNEWENEQTGDDIICPWCGYVESDSWENRDDYDGDYECMECGKPFAWERVVDVTYRSRKRREDYPGREE